ncbi:MAG: hypothetical protein AAFW01_10385 [Pseudomonadota bacterium]
MFKNLWKELVKEPIGSSKDLVSTVSTVGGSAAALLGFLDSLGVTNIPIISVVAEAPLPFRVVVFLLFASGVGWTFGLMVANLTIERDEAGLWLAHLAAFLLAILMLGCASWLSMDVGETPLPEESLFAFVGLAVVMTFARMKFRSVGAPSLDAVAARSGTMLSFAIATVLMAGISGMTGAAG